MMMKFLRNLPEHPSDSEAECDSEDDGHDVAPPCQIFQHGESSSVTDHGYGKANDANRKETQPEAIRNLSEREESSEDSGDENEWKKDRQWFQNATVPAFSKIAQPTYDFCQRDDPLNYFSRFLTDDIVKNISDQTNLYATQRKCLNWSECNEKELYAFFGILLLMGVHILPSIDSYWSTNPLLGVLAVSKVMTCKRFKKILSALHCNDNSLKAKDDVDKLYKVRPLLTELNKNCLKECQPSSNQSIDESMIRFKGRCSLKQYMPKKPIKRGYKAWARADSETGYIYEFQIYTGKMSQGTEHLLGERVVLDLTENLRSSLTLMTFDNFFSSTNLLQELLFRGIWSCGTVRSFRKDLPLISKNKKKMKRGQYKWRCKDDVTAVQWMDNKLVNIISTVHDPQETVFVKRKQKDGSSKEIASPIAVAEYNRHMGGVDNFDQLRQCYEVGRRSRKWWLRIFYFCIDVAVVNSFLLWNMKRKEFGKNKFSQLEYRLQLIPLMIGGFSSRKRRGSTPDHISKRSRYGVPEGVRKSNIGIHFPAPIKTYRRCRMCSAKQREKRTKVECVTCKVPLCATPCFSQFH